MSARNGRSNFISIGSHVYWGYMRGKEFQLPVAMLLSIHFRYLRLLSLVVLSLVVPEPLVFLLV